MKICIRTTSIYNSTTVKTTLWFDKFVICNFHSQSHKHFQKHKSIWHIWYFSLWFRIPQPFSNDYITNISLTWLLPGKFGIWPRGHLAAGAPWSLRFAQIAASRRSLPPSASHHPRCPPTPLCATPFPLDRGFWETTCSPSCPWIWSVLRTSFLQHLGVPMKKL